jgi:hypothetical protein
MLDALIEHPRRALLLLLAVCTVAVGGPAVPTYVTEHQRPRNDQATLDQLRSQFAQSAWVSSLVSAYWDAPDDLNVGLDSDDRQLALAACSDLIDLVKVRTSTGPDGVTYTTTYSDGSLYIVDRSNNIMMTNFLSLHSGSRWRLS